MEISRSFSWHIINQLTADHAHLSCSFQSLLAFHDSIAAQSCVLPVDRNGKARRKPVTINTLNNRRRPACSTSWGKWFLVRAAQPNRSSKMKLPAKGTRVFVRQAQGAGLSPAATHIPLSHTPPSVLSEYGQNTPDCQQSIAKREARSLQNGIEVEENKAPNRTHW